MTSLNLGLLVKPAGLQAEFFQAAHQAAQIIVISFLHSDTVLKRSRRLWCTGLSVPTMHPCHYTLVLETHLYCAPAPWHAFRLGGQAISIGL